jgi:predicted metal-dependent peptidase
MAASLSVEKELVKGIVDIARHKEFYGHIIQQLERVFVDGKHRVQTAAVGRVPGDRFIKMYLNRTFFGNLLEDGTGIDAKGNREKGWTYMLGVLEHEIVHCVFQHLFLKFQDKNRGNVACVPAGTEILGKGSIESCRVGDNFLNEGGRCGILRTYENDYDGQMLTVKANCLIPFDITPEHPVLVCPYRIKSIRRKGIDTVVKDFGDRVFLKAGEIQTVRRPSGVPKSGYMLVVPKIKRKLDIDFVSARCYESQSTSVFSSLVGLKFNGIRLDEEAGWVMGLYMAEGGSRGGNAVSFSLHVREMDKAERVRRFFESRYGLTPRIRRCNHTEKGLTVDIASPIIRRSFVDWFGSGAKSKKIPDWIMLNRNDGFVRSFIQGYFSGDGNFYEKRRSVSMSTASAGLALQVQALCASFGFLMGLSKTSQKKDRKIRARVVWGKKIKERTLSAGVLYSLQSCHKDAVSFLGFTGGSSKKFYLDVGDAILTPIGSVASRAYSGKVYNIGTQTGTYTVSNAVVHNCDLVVNGILPEDTLPGNYVLPEHYGLERGKSAMWYYTHLQSNKTYQKQCSEGQFGTEGVLSHIMSSHAMWEDLKDDLVAKEFAKDIVRKAKDLCNKNYGNIPGEVLAQIDDLLKGEKAIVPWGKVLRMFVASCSESILDYTVKRISRRFSTRPGTRKGEVLRIAVAVDTSGSISDSQLKVFFNEIRWIWKNGAQIVVYEADCRVCAVYPFKGKFTGKVHGRGGTDLEPVLKDVENAHFDALIYFTDFIAPVVSRRYRMPTLWVLDSDMDRESYPAKWGRHIRIDGRTVVAAA